MSEFIALLFQRLPLGDHGVAFVTRGLGLGLEIGDDFARLLVDMRPDFGNEVVIAPRGLSFFLRFLGCGSFIVRLLFRFSLILGLLLFSHLRGFGDFRLERAI